MKRALIIVVALAVWAPTAHADPLIEFGFGGRASGMAGAGVATATGVDAAHHNPAGVASAKYPSFMLGYGYGAMALSINGRGAGVLDAHGTSIGAALPFSIDDDTAIALGLALYLPDQFIARIQQIPPTEPHFILLDNNPHRLVVEPVLSLKLNRYVSLGAGASILGAAKGNGITFNVGVESGNKVGEAELDAALPLTFAPLAGITVSPTPKIRAGLVYRGELSLDLALDILANVNIAGVVSGDALVAVRAANYFTPQRVSGGIAVDVMDDLTLSADLSWNNWSAHPSGLADLRILVALDITPPLVQTDVPPAGFNDTVSGRIGAEYRVETRRIDWALRAGYAYVPTPVPDQTGLTSFADNDRHVLSLGAGMTLADFAPLLTRPVSFNIGLQWHHLMRRLTQKDAMQFPGESFASGGNIFHINATTTVRF